MLHKRQERSLLLTLAAVQFTHIMDFMIMMPLGPQLMRLFNIQPQQFALLVSAYTFSAAISGFCSAFFIDRFDRKQVLHFLYGGFILGTLACALASRYEWLLAARILTGSFGGILSALILAVISDVIPMERRGTAMGTVTASFSVASVLGVPLGLFLANHLSWHAPFLFLVAVGTGVQIMIQQWVPSLRNHIQVNAPVPPAAQILGQAVQHPAQRYALLLTFLMMIGQFSIIPFLSPSMVANVGFKESQLTYIYLMGGAATLITGPLIGRLADKWGKLKALTLFMLLSLVPQFVITHLGPTHLFTVLIMTTGFFVISGGRMIPSMALISNTVQPETRGSFMSIQSSIQQMASGFAAMLAGWIVFKNAHGQLLHFDRIGYIAILTTLLCIPVAWRMTAFSKSSISLRQAE